MSAPAEHDERLRPLHDQLVVRVEPGAQVLTSGLYKPDIAREKETGAGIVVAVGPGRVNPETGVRSEMEVKVGERVAYEVFRAIHKAVRGDETYAIIEQRHVLGILEPGADVEVRG